MILPYPPRENPVSQKLYVGGYLVTQLFDANPQSYRPYGLPAHEGIDIGLPVNTPLLAVNDAVVTLAIADGTKSAYGRYVKIKWIDAGVSHVALYAHATQIKCVVGQAVRQGDVLALSGNTGRSTGPHLHYTLIIGQGQVASQHGGKFPVGYVDPLPYMLGAGGAGQVPTWPDQMRHKVVATQGVRVRVAPSTTGKIVTTLPWGTIVALTESSAADGQYVWRKICGDFTTPQYNSGFQIGGSWIATGTVQNPNAFLVYLP